MTSALFWEVPVLHALQTSVVPGLPNLTAELQHQPILLQLQMQEMKLFLLLEIMLEHT